MEIYKDIEGYEGLYQVSNLGNVKSLERKVMKGNGNGGLHTLPEKILKAGKGGNGYYLVVLSKDGKHKNKMVHRLVAEAFIPNPDQLQYINHKDENPSNNRVENLEWCTPKYNCNYGNRNKKIAKAVGKPILCVELNKTFASLTEAERWIGIDGAKSTICNCLTGKYNSAYGYKWKYVV